MRLLVFLLLLVNCVFVHAQSFVFAQLNGSPVMNVTGWNLTGNAFVGDTPGDIDNFNNELILTSPANGQSGGAFFANPIDPSICSRWTVEFEYRMWDGNAADGIAFCFLDVPPAGFVSGGGIGIPGAANGLKVVLDSWDNCGLANPELQIFNGLGYNECVAGIVKIGNVGGNLNFVRNANYQPAKIVYDNGNIDFYINNTLYLSTFSLINFSGYMGFTASTGGFNDRHSIRNVIIYTEQAVSDAGLDMATCSDTSVQVGSANNPNYQYLWTPAIGLSDSTLSDPVCTLTNISGGPITQQYIVTTTLTNNPSGCPNTDTVVVTVLPSLDTTLNVTLCDSQYLFNGTAIGVSGVYTENFQTQNGCDSLVTLNLTINNSVSSIDNQISCGPFTWVDGVVYSTSTTTPNYVVPSGAANGCDSVVTLHLTVLDIPTGVDSQTACESFTWIDGVVYTSSTTTPTHVITGGAANGCDSIVTLDLTVIYNASSFDSHVSCNSFLWVDGNTYVSSNNTATDTIYGGAANGCDSIVTLDLTIFNDVNYTDVIFACDSFTWIDGTTYYSNNTSAEFTYPAASLNGCDSIVSLDLTVHTSTLGTDIQTSCGPYTWINGIEYSASTTAPFDTLFGAAYGGCDSIVNLNLIVFEVPELSISDDTTVCIGSEAVILVSGAFTYVWSSNSPTPNGSQIMVVPSTTSTYTVTGTTTDGCFSSASSTVDVVPNPVASFYVTPSELDILYNTTASFSNTSTNATYYQWDMGDGSPYIYSEDATHTFDSETVGTYAVGLYVENSEGCSDSTIVFVDVIEGLSIFIPNTFTPDGDKFNQRFNPVLAGDFDVDDYSFEIFNRWGNLVFFTTDPAEGWDGGFENHSSQAGTYQYKLTYRRKNDFEKSILVGHVNLIR